MARVFLPPTYDKQDLQGMFGVSDCLTGSGETMAMMAACGMRVEPLTWLDGDLEEDEMLDSASYVMGLNRDAAMLRRRAEIATHVWDWLAERKFKLYTDFDAVIRVYYHVLNGDFKIDQGITNAAKEAEKISKDIAAVGMIASFATPVSCAKASSGVLLMNHLSSYYPKVARAMCLSDALKLGSSIIGASMHYAEVMRGEAEAEMSKFHSESKGLGKWLKNVKVHAIGSFTLLLYGSNAFLIGRDNRMQLADCLWSVGMMHIYGLNYRRGEQEVSQCFCAQKTLQYVLSSIKIRLARNDDVKSLARQMKSSYALFLAQYGSSSYSTAERKLVDEQLASLKLEAEGYSRGEQLWCDYVKDWTDDQKVDLGTAWNLLPASGAKLHELDRALQKKLNKPRHPDVRSWEDFFGYARGVITAHILVKRPDINGEWSEDDAEDQEWVKKCREGTLTYPEEKSPCYIRKCFPWVKHLESWSYTSQDVTHVNSNLESYSTRESIANLDREQTSELLYALTHGSILSNKYRPEQIRQSWERGEIPGDRLMLIAAKCENTKFDDKVRETMSADDVQRECLTELDINVSLLGGMVDGVASRSGRRGGEVKMNKVITRKSDDDLLFSLDVSGWSPNMIREYEIKFANLLMEFYDIPDEQRANCLLDHTIMINSRRGYHSIWESRDGSFQGLLGTVDTILHSIMAQWAFNRCKSEGVFGRSTKVRKIALIDDIIMSIDNCKIAPEKAAEAIAKKYLSLGFATEIAKSLISFVKGHFLNRLYYNQSEVITAAKIFARSDREWERQFVSIHDEFDSIFGSMSGAVDRGADGVLGYCTATWRSCWRAITIENRLLSKGMMLSILGCWLPRCLGGWGLPTFVNWTSREGVMSMDASIGACTTIGRVIKQSDPHAYAAIHTVLNAVAKIPLSARTALSVADDPYSITSPIIPDPSIPIRTLNRKCMDKIALHNDYKGLIGSVTNSRYQALFETTLKSGEYSAPLIAEWSGCMPHAVARIITEKVGSSEALLMKIPARQRRQARNDLRSANREALQGYMLLEKKMLRNIDYSPVLPDCGSSLAVFLRKRSMEISGFRLRDLAAPAALDVIGQCQPGHNLCFQVHIPPSLGSSLYTGAKVKKKTLVRTSCAESLVMPGGETQRSADPLMQTVHRMASVVAVSKAINMPCQNLIAAYATAWTGTGTVIDFPNISISGHNPYRLSSRIKLTNYTTACYPNFSQYIKVDASSIIRQYDQTPLSLSILAVIYSLKTAAALDVAVGGVAREGTTRCYVLRPASVMFRDTAPYPPENEPKCPEMRGCLGDQQTDRFSENMRLLLGEVRIGTTKVEEGVFNEFADVVVQISATKLLMSRPAGSLISTLLVGSANTKPGLKTDKNADVQIAQKGEVVETIGHDERQIVVICTKIAKAKSIGDTKKLAKCINALESNLQDVSGTAKKLGILNLLRDAVSKLPDTSNKAIAKITAMCMCGRSIMNNDRARFYTDLAAIHMARSQERDGAYGFRSLFLSEVFGSWVSNDSGRYDLGVVFMATLQAFDNVILRITQRHVKCRPIVLISLKDRMEKLLKIPDGFKKEMYAVVSASLPDNWKEQDQIAEGAMMAAKDVGDYLMTDWARPAASVENKDFNINLGQGRAQDKVYLPVRLKAFVFEDTMEDEPEVDLSRWDAFCMENMVIAEPGDELWLEDYQSWMENRNIEDDNAADV